MITAANNGNNTFNGGIDLLAMAGGIKFTSELAMAYGASAETKGSNFETTNFTIGFAALYYVDTTVPYVPSAPLSPAATQTGATTATVTWTAPLSPGSQPITGYTVTPSTGGTPVTVAGNVLTASMTGLTTGTPVTFTVKATNSVGRPNCAGCTYRTRSNAGERTERPHLGCARVQRRRVYHELLG